MKTKAPECEVMLVRCTACGTYAVWECKGWDKFECHECGGIGCEAITVEDGRVTVMRERRLKQEKPSCNNCGWRRHNPYRMMPNKEMVHLSSPLGEMRLPGCSEWLRLGIACNDWIQNGVVVIERERKLTRWWQWRHKWKYTQT